MAKTKGFMVERVQIFDSLTKKAKDIRQENEKENRATEETGSNKHFRSKTTLKKPR